MLHGKCAVERRDRERGLRRDVAIIVGLATVGLVFACGPAREVLTSAEDAPAEATGDVLADLPPPDQPIDAFGPCTKDEQCPSTYVCEKDSCVPCTTVMSCDTSCPIGYEKTAIERNGCSTCECLPQAKCASSVECKFGELCFGGVCQACGTFDPGCDPPCPLGLQHFSVKRHGCSVCECALPDQCTNDKDCGDPATSQCYAGPIIDDACDGSPSCAHGNVCSTPGCKPIAFAATTCAFDGCADDLRCHVGKCMPAFCKCDPPSGGWACSPPCTEAVCTTDP